jgi:hypothetical protein
MKLPPAPNLVLMLFLCLKFISTDLCFADDAVDPKEAYKRAQNIEVGGISKLDEIIRGSGGIEKFDDVLLGKGEIKNKAEDLGQLPLAGEKLKEDVKEKEEDIKCTIDGCNVANAMGSKALHERESRLESLGFSKDKDQFPEDNKGAIDKAHYNAKKFRETFDAISGSYKDCKPIENSRIHKEEIECDEYYDVKYKNCPISQVVEIDPKYTYQCTKKRSDAIKTCHDEIVSIQCKKDMECDNNGIILSTVNTNLQSQSYTYPTLYVGTPYWKPDACTIDSSKYTTFTVKNVKNVKNFILERVLFDDYVMIKLNDTLVYHGPDSEANEDRIELVTPGRWGTITTNGHNRKGCERSTNWDKYPRKDLKEYLKEGENRISIIIATAGHGRAEMWIRTTQHCCKEWNIKRETQCKYEGAS